MYGAVVSEPFADEGAETDPAPGPAGCGSPRVWRSVVACAALIGVAAGAADYSSSAFGVATVEPPRTHHHAADNAAPSPLPAADARGAASAAASASSSGGGEDDASDGGSGQAASLLASSAAAEAEQPVAAGSAAAAVDAVVFVLIDDLGQNDIGYSSSDMAPFTPRLDALALDGVRLTRFYSLHMCTPARSALLTGLYPIRYGMTHDVVTRTSPYGVPLHFAFLPELMRSASDTCCFYTPAQWAASRL